MGEKAEVEEAAVVVEEAQGDLEASEWVRLGEAARRVGCSAPWISALVRAGRLPAVRTPLGKLYPRGAVEAIRAERVLRGLA